MGTHKHIIINNMQRSVEPTLIILMTTLIQLFINNCQASELGPYIGVPIMMHIVFCGEFCVPTIRLEMFVKIRKL